MDNNFSAQVKEIISYSREEALRLGNDFIGTEHLVLGLIRDGENTAIKILKSLNVDLYELRKEIELAVKDKTGKNIANINSLPLTKQAEKVIRITVLEAKANKSPLVESEHLMLSILKNKENIATQILNQFDIDYDMFKNELGYVKTDPKAEFQDDETASPLRRPRRARYRCPRRRQAGQRPRQFPCLRSSGSRRLRPRGMSARPRQESHSVRSAGPGEEAVQCRPAVPGRLRLGSGIQPDSVRPALAVRPQSLRQLLLRRRLSLPGQSAHDVDPAGCRGAPSLAGKSIGSF